MHVKEIETVSNLEPFERYNYFIKKIADFEILYSLKSLEGNFAISETNNKYMFPIWSHEEFAKLNLNKEWENFEICEISLEELEEGIFHFILENNYLINVFPMNNKTGFVVNLEEFKRDLSIELENYQ
ncbi:MAG: hypothetical protein K0R77_2610 [Chryseobacterium sp.]|jgi:hypothetical protein|uniref:DUF2750 domain-containing protein n=1 Tax=Chryseobacterium sp. TaxID=1871047 RepID=UPI0026343360|nr:DUF2750 domain-containing protein [Chryseobacterium sp.]MDF2553335.1 hypothetical protein [Chryseobacterium sp.]